MNRTLGIISALRRGSIALRPREAAVIKLLLTFATVVDVLGQGTTEFNVHLMTVPPFASTPAEEYTGNGQFVLNGSLFSGTLFYSPLDGQSFTRIENSAGQPLFSPMQEHGLPPEIVNEATWSDLQLTDAQVTELLAGQWQINIGSVDYPGGALRGQIATVPEPGTFALFGCGAMLMAISVIRRGCR